MQTSRRIRETNQNAKRIMQSHCNEIGCGQRFAFGENWSRFLSILDEQRIEQAKNSLRAMLKMETLEGKTFLDIGSGSGLFSLAARSLGARVHSFDYDPDSVECAEVLKAKRFLDDPQWTIERASALDATYLSKLGEWNVVYCWGYCIVAAPIPRVSYVNRYLKRFSDLYPVRIKAQICYLEVCGI